MSTGKTEVMKGMMFKLLNAGKKCHFIFFTHRSEKKSLLQLQMEIEFEKHVETGNMKISLLAIDAGVENLSLKVSIF